MAVVGATSVTQWESAQEAFAKQIVAFSAPSTSFSTSFSNRTSFDQTPSAPSSLYLEEKSTVRSQPTLLQKSLYDNIFKRKPVDKTKVQENLTALLLYAEDRKETKFLNKKLAELGLSSI